MMLTSETTRHQTILRVIQRLESKPENLKSHWCIPPEQAQVIYSLARTANAQRILEIGTSLGYSTLWLGLALRENAPQGTQPTLDSIEASSERRALALKHIEAAGLSDIVSIHQADALQWMDNCTQRMQTVQERTTYDMVFIDANKAQTIDYWQWLQGWVHTGTLVVVDNTQSHRESMMPFIVEASSDSRWASWEITWGNGMWCARRR